MKEPAPLNGAKEAHVCAGCAALRQDRQQLISLANLQRQRLHQLLQDLEAYAALVNSSLTKEQHE